MLQQPEKGLCSRCKKMMMLDVNFYKNRAGKRLSVCKKCLSAHIDNTNPETFLWILEELDVPYVSYVWDELLIKSLEQDPNKIGGNAVLGKYLATMKLRQWVDYHWADNEKLNIELAEQRQAAQAQQAFIANMQQEVLQEQYENGVLSDEEFEAYQQEIQADPLQKTKEKAIEKAKNALSSSVFDAIVGKSGSDNPYDERELVDEDNLPDPSEDLTEEDKKYLAMKWGTLYRPREWLQLEQYYVDMCDSFDIQDADTRSTLILLSKTNLKMNQALDAGDINSYRQLAIVSDAMRKSAKFMANQRKEEGVNCFNSIGEVVLLAEKEGGFIPRYCTDIPQDHIDIAIQDNKEYLYNLVTQELGFAQQIEDAIKRIEMQNRLEQEESFDAETMEDLDLAEEDVFNYERLTEIEGG